MESEAVAKLNPNTLEHRPKSVLSTVLSGICGGRTYTFKKGALQAAQVATISTLAYMLFSSIISPSENTDIVTDFSIAGSILLLSVASAREILHCSRRFKDDKKGIFNPWVLLTVGLLAGAVTTQVYYSQALDELKEYNENNQAFNQSFLSCLNFIDQNAANLTAAPCVPCTYSQDGDNVFPNTTIFQYLLKQFDEIVCSTPANQYYWNELVDINANQTNGNYPCGPEMIPSNQSNKANATELAYFDFFNVQPPLVFSANFVNETCKRIFGFGTRAFSLTGLCGTFFDAPETIGDYDYDMLECMKPGLIPYMQNYVETIRNYINPSDEPTAAYDILDKTPVKTLWACTSISAVTAVAYEFILRQLKQRGEYRPILN